MRTNRDRILFRNPRRSEMREKKETYRVSQGLYQCQFVWFVEIELASRSKEKTNSTSTSIRLDWTTWRRTDSISSSKRSGFSSWLTRFSDWIERKCFLSLLWIYIHLLLLVYRFCFSLEIMTTLLKSSFCHSHFHTHGMVWLEMRFLFCSHCA